MNSKGLLFKKLDMHKNSSSIYELVPLHIIKLRSKNNEIALSEFMNMEKEGQFIIKRADIEFQSYLSIRIRE